MFTRVLVPLPARMLVPAATVIPIPRAFMIALVIMLRLVIPVVVAIPIAVAVVNPVPVTIPVMVPVAIPVPVMVPVAIVTVIPVGFAVLPVIGVALVAVIVKIVAQLGAVVGPSSFVLAERMLIFGHLLTIRVLVTNQAIAIFPPGLTAGGGMRLVGIAVPALLEPVNALGQFLTVNAVVRPAAHDLPEPLVETAAPRRILNRPARPAEVIADFCARSQSPARPRRGIVAPDDSAKRQASGNCRDKALHDVLLCEGETHRITSD
jgi:hypothetical protein